MSIDGKGRRLIAPRCYALPAALSFRSRSRMLPAVEPRRFVRVSSGCVTLYRGASLPRTVPPSGARA